MMVVSTGGGGTQRIRRAVPQRPTAKTVWPTIFRARTVLAFARFEAAMPADCGEADDQRRQEGRVAEPAGAPDEDDDAREEDADGVMRNPADGQLVADRLRARDVLMQNASAWQMREPAADERPVRQG